MPGLVGVFTPRGQECPPAASALVERMVAAVRHRPWYRVARHHEPGCDIAVAHVHLGILDAPPQPYVDPAAPVKVFLHGELYNDEAAGDPLAFVARCYARHGLDFAAHLNGSFVTVVLDDAHDRILVAMDRTASKPLFYWHDGTRLYIGPELKALLALPHLPRRLHVPALASFLSAGHFVNGHTLLGDVQVLDGATALVLGAGGLRTHRYWEYAFAESPRDRGWAHYQTTLTELIRVAVRRRLRTPHRYGILLSGGYDSRGILGAWLADPPATPALSISWGTTEDLPGSDCAVARRLAGRLGLTHHFLRLRPAHLPRHLPEFVRLHDGLTDACINYPEALRLFEEIRAELGVDVLLRGDECFGFSQPAGDETTMFAKYGLVPLSRVGIYETILTARARAACSDALADTLRALSRRCRATDICLRQNFFYLDQRIKHYLHPLNALKSLAVEIRTPYLDNDILDFMRELPAAYQFGKRLYRRAIVATYPELFTEFARVSSLGDWTAELRAPALRDYVRGGLLADGPGLEDLVERDALARVMDQFFSGETANGASPARLGGLKSFLTRYPALYRFAQRRYRARAHAGDGHRIPVVKVLLRLLVLKQSVEMLVTGQPVEGALEHAR